MSTLRAIFRERPYVPVGLVCGLVALVLVLVLVPQWANEIADVVLVAAALTLGVTLLRRRG